MTQAQALAILKTGVNVFLTGEPGSGKTHTVNEYAAYLRRRKIEPAITASTGIAATHLSGMTIHSWSGIGVRDKLDKYDLDRIASTERVARRIENSQVLVIDEISMLSGQTLSMVDVVCREVRRSPAKPFGGLQVIFVGDFFQLPPVVKDEQTRVRFAYDSPAWEQASPMVCYLTEQYRQDDSEFINLLSAIRANAFTDSHERHIESRKIEHSAVPDNIPRFFSHNAEVDRVNEATLDKLPGKPRVFIMSHKGPKALVQSLKAGCLSPEKLLLKAGAAAMFTKNNPRAGFVNGTLGVVKKFAQTSGLPLVKIRNGRTIEVEPMDWNLEENGRVRAKVTQMPLRLAWAITIHKSQGMSLDAAAMDLSGVFEFGQGYVALSRVRRLSGLHIFGWNQRAFQVHPEILARDLVFRAASSDAGAALEKLSAPEIQKIQENFAAHCGGQPETNRPEAESDTYAETLALWNQGKAVAEMARERGLKEGTILAHLEKLSRESKISKSDLSRVLTPALAKALPEIHAAFRELGAEKLSPVFEKLGGRHSYDELRIARMMFKRE